MSVPFIGEIRLFGFNFAPVGWQACNGALLQISQNETLFALLGTTYGGDGQATFGVPDLRGRIPIHQGQGPGLSNYVIGQVAGAETVTLTAQQMPSHTHALGASTAAATTVAPSNTVVPGAISGDTMYAADLTGATAVAMSAQSTTTAGGAQPHDNTMPTLVANWCVASEGIFPSQN